MLRGDDMEHQAEGILNSLREEEAKIRDAMRAEQIDFTDEESVGAFERGIDEIFRERIRAYREIDKRSDVLRVNDWDDSILLRRKQAVRRLAQTAQEQFGGKFPDISVAEEFVRISAPCDTLTFDALNKEYDVELAAAIWALDYLDAHELLGEAAAFFPQTEEELRSVPLPNLTDSAHSDELLRAMKYLIRSRNRGRKGFDEKKAWMDAADAAAASEEEKPEDRKRFDAVIALIDDDTKEELQKEFLSCFGKLTEELLALIAEHKIKADELRGSILGELRTQTELCEKARADVLVPSADIGAAEELTVTRSDPFFEAAPQLQASRVRESALRKKLEEEENAVGQICHRLLLLPSLKQEDAGEFAGFEGPEILRPFEMCFAFLLLLDGDSDEIWTYNLSYDVLAYACRALPWAGCHAVDPDDGGEMQVDVELLATLAEKTPGWDENNTADLLYLKRLPSPLLSPDSDRISIAQLAFLSTGLIPPRQNDMLAFTKILLSSAELTKNEADVWYAYVMLAYAVAHKEPDYTAEESEDAQDSEAQKNADEEIKALKNEIKNLKSRLNRLEHRNKEYAQELAKADRELKASVTELSELRTMIRESVNSQEDSPVTVAFPYTSKRRAVIIGGHPSWVNAIRPLLENVRFISSSEQPHPGVIMNAEIVWLQTNALGHSGYYKIIDIVRRNNIKVCYFSYASAEKCAEQFALEDMAGDAQAEEE